jgi:hypothetical protein
MDLIAWAAGRARRAAARGRLEELERIARHNYALGFKAANGPGVKHVEVAFSDGELRGMLDGQARVEKVVAEDVVVSARRRARDPEKGSRVEGEDEW